MVLAAIVFFYRLGDPPLKNWDEAIYAQVAKEMLQTGDWFSLRWQQAVWFEKPPLTIWVIASLFRIFGMNEFWARAISAFSGVGVVAVTYAIGKRIRGQVCGLLAALILLTTFQFVQFARLLTTDVLLLLFIYLSIYCYLHARNGDTRWWYLASLCCALGFMVRDFAVLVGPPAIGFALVFHAREVKNGRFSWVFLALIAIVLGFYSTAQTKLGWYVLPVYPALALLISHLLIWVDTHWRFSSVRVAIILVCVVFASAAIGKIKSYYVKIEEPDVAVKDMALLAGKEAVSQTLVLFSPHLQFDGQSALFYSNRRVVQPATNIPAGYGGTRYQNYKLLADVTTEEPTAILLMKQDIEPLLADYTLTVAGESHNLVYATIRKRVRHGLPEKSENLTRSNNISLPFRAKPVRAKPGG